MYVIIALCRCYYRSFELHLAGVCVCVYRGESFRRISRRDHRASFKRCSCFCASEIRFSERLCLQETAISYPLFFFIHTAGSRYVLRFCISGLICTRVVVFRWIGLWNYFYKRRKQKDVVVQQSKADRLPFASQRTHI